MNRRQGRPRQLVRSVFISDTHLGCKYSQADSLVAFLDEISPDYLYLVGDFIDGWRLRRSWHWQPAFSRVLRRLLDLAKAGVRIRYTPGNHDDFLRQFLHDFGFLEIADEFTHEAADGRRYLVLHGDRFDNVEIRAQWLSVVGAVGYDWLMWVDNLLNRGRRLLGQPPIFLSGYLKRRLKQAISFVSKYEQQLTREAFSQGCDGVICGHVHTPAISDHRVFSRVIRYLNTGDWMEHRTALVEYWDGALELIHLPAAGEPMPVFETAPPDRAARGCAASDGEILGSPSQIVPHRQLPVGAA